MLRNTAAFCKEVGRVMAKWRAAGVRTRECGTKVAAARGTSPLRRRPGGPVRCYSGRVSTRAPAGNSAASGGITSQRSA